MIRLLRVRHQLFTGQDLNGILRSLEIVLQAQIGLCASFAGKNTVTSGG